MTEWQSEPLRDDHDVSAFDCGKPTLNQWLKEHALRAQGSDTARTYVWTSRTYVWTSSENPTVVAYYSVAPCEVIRGEAPGKMSGGLSKIPAYLLARLALDKSLIGQGLGAELLNDALTCICQAAKLASGRLIVVDALDDDAKGFYLHHGFVPARGDNPMRLIIKISTVRDKLGDTTG